MMHPSEHEEVPRRLSPFHETEVIEEFVWATSDQARERARSLYVIRSIVEKHGGTIQINVETNTLDIDVPEERRHACAQEIEENMGALCS
jgi:hypothetical protein